MPTHSSDNLRLSGLRTPVEPTRSARPPTVSGLRINPGLPRSSQNTAFSGAHLHPIERLDILGSYSVHLHRAIQYDHSTISSLWPHTVMTNVVVVSEIDVEVVMFPRPPRFGPLPFLNPLMCLAPMPRSLRRSLPPATKPSLTSTTTYQYSISRLEARMVCILPRPSSFLSLYLGTIDKHPHPYLSLRAATST